MNDIIKNSKEVPGVGKYSKLSNWSKESVKCKFMSEKKITLFAQLGKESRKKPGPGTYNGHHSLDKMILGRVKGTYTR